MSQSRPSRNVRRYAQVYQAGWRGGRQHAWRRGFYTGILLAGGFAMLLAYVLRAAPETGLTLAPGESVTVAIPLESRMEREARPTRLHQLLAEGWL